MASPKTSTRQKPVPVLLLYGGIAAAAMVLLVFMTYKGGIESFLNKSVWLINLIPLTFGVIAALTERKRQGNYLEFRSALRIIFGILVIALAVQGLFIWLLTHVFDTHFGQALIPAWLKDTETTYRRFGMPEDEIAKNIAAEKGTDPFDIPNTMLGLARDYIVGFLISLILAAITKRKKPEERQPITQ